MAQVNRKGTHTLLVGFLVTMGFMGFLTFGTPSGGCGGGAGTSPEKPGENPGSEDPEDGSEGNGGAGGGEGSGGGSEPEHDGHFLPPEDPPDEESPDVTFYTSFQMAESNEGEVIVYAKLSPGIAIAGFQFVLEAGSRDANSTSPGKFFLEEVETFDTDELNSFSVSFNDESSIILGFSITATTITSDQDSGNVKILKVKVQVEDPSLPSMIAVLNEVVVSGANGIALEVESVELGP